MYKQSGSDKYFWLLSIAPELELQYTQNILEILHVRDIYFALLCVGSSANPIPYRSFVIQP